MGNPPFTLVPSLADHAQVQPGGIVSLSLHKGAGGKAVLFVFDAGQELSEHTAAVPADLHLVSGRMTWGLGGEFREVHPGAWAHMEAGLPHSVTALEPSVMLLTMHSGAAKPGRE